MGARPNLDVVQDGLPRRARQRASILIISMWVLFLLSVIAVTIASSARQRLHFLQWFDERRQLRTIAEAGIWRGELELLKKMHGSNEVPFDALKERWATNPYFKDVFLGKGAFSILYTQTDCSNGVETVHYGIVDEERKININTASFDTLKILFANVTNIGDSRIEELAACLIDWRDPDSALTRPSSAEDSFYKNLRDPYVARNEDFQVLDELFLVKGVDSCVYNMIKDYITIYGNGRVNINTAPQQVLRALGLTDPLIDDILRFRAGKDETEATEDDNVFESVEEIVPRLSQEYHLSPEAIKILSDVTFEYFTTASAYYMIRSVSRLPHRPSTREIVCVINRHTGDIRYWRE